MKADDYYQRLSQLAVYKLTDNVDARGGSIEVRRAKAALIKLKENDDWQDDDDTRDLVEQLEEFIKPKKNWTLPIQLVKIKRQPQACEDCGIVVEDRRVNKKLCSHPIPHWRTSCSSCRKTYNPQTEKFDLHSTQIQNFFVAYFRNCDK